jgi:hypothetical protein
MERRQVLLRAVAVLHARGYHGVRIKPGLSASGMHWRCELYVKSSQVRIAQSSNGIVSGMTACDAPETLATALEANPQLARARQPDLAYVAWYAAMLATLGDALPISFADWDLPTDHWITTASELIVPLPPA